MKRVLLLLSMFVASASLADTLADKNSTEKWYGYCIAEKDGERICSNPTDKLDDMKAKCTAFSEDSGTSGYEIQYNTDLERLKEEMPNHCDKMSDHHGDVFACKYAMQCPHGAPRVAHFANRVYGSSRAAAVRRCEETNEFKIKDKLVELSTKDCFLKLVADKTH